MGCLAAPGWAVKAPYPFGGIEGLVTVTVGHTICAIGGWDGSALVDRVVPYYPHTDTWGAPLTPMPTPRTHLAAVEVDGMIYAIGGLGSGWAVLDTVEVYDVAGDTWNPIGPLTPVQTPRELLGAATVDGLIYAIGGHP